MGGDSSRRWRRSPTLAHCRVAIAISALCACLGEHGFSLLDELWLPAAVDFQLLLLFVRRAHLAHVSSVQHRRVRKPLLETAQSKLAVAASLEIYGCRICFVACHLTPHGQFLQVST